MNNDLAEMLRYNAWANRELFGACAALSDEQLDTRIQGISGSVRELHACADDGGPAGSDIVKVRNTPRKPGLFIALLGGLKNSRRKVPAHIAPGTAAVFLGQLTYIADERRLELPLVCTVHATSTS